MSNNFGLTTIYANGDVATEWFATEWDQAAALRSLIERAQHDSTVDAAQLVTR